MTNYDRIVKKAKARYPFLRDTFIEIDTESPAYGCCGTVYQPSAETERGGSITLVLAEVKDKWEYERARYERRLGRLKSLEDAVLAFLLHEVCHALQHQTLGVDALRKDEYARSQIDNAGNGVNDSPLEKAADAWARKEFKRWEK